MGDGGGSAAPLPRLVAAIPVAFLCLSLLTRFGNAVYWSGLSGGVVLACLFVPPLLYTVPRGRALWARHPYRLLAVQAVLTYAPLAAFGQNWINIAPGLLAGLLLLAVPPPRSWLLFGGVLAAEVVRIAVLGIPAQLSTAAIVTWMLVAPANTGLAFYGLVRLADMVKALHAARAELAHLAVARERRQAADRLRGAVDDHLEAVAALVEDALAALPGTPDRARNLVTEASGRARRALAQIRAVIATDRPRDDHGEADRPGGHAEEPLPDGGQDARPRPKAGPLTRPAGLPALRARLAGTGVGGEVGGEAGGDVAPRRARWTLAVVLASYGAILMANIVTAGGAPLAMAGAAATIVAVAALQLYHSFGWGAGSPPRDRGWTLAAQILLPFAWTPAYDWNVLTLAGTAAGSALLLLPRLWGWAVCTAVLAGVGVAWTLPVLGVYYGANNRYVQVVATDKATVLYQLGAVATAAIVVYGLSRLTGLAEQVAAARRELARSAVERERLRVAQDTHDVLGLGLSAVALKCDLAGRLIGRDEARARAELQALLRLTAQSRADIRAVAADTGTLSLAAELAFARDLLASTGITVEVRDETHGAPLPAAVDEVLATMLREAVTNVLRHAPGATRCEIELAADENEVRLGVTNDGAVGEPAAAGAASGRAGGHGLVNLTGRAAALGGGVTTAADVERGRFALTVRVPLTGSR